MARKRSHGRSDRGGNPAQAQEDVYGNDGANYRPSEEERKAPSSAEIASAYRSRGWRPIPIQLGAKGPTDQKWDKKDYDDVDLHFNGAKNIGVQLGPLSAGLTDVDLDCAEAILLAPDFLPHTDAVFGRKSKPRSHYLFVINDPEPKATIKLVDERAETIIELRMGGGDKGRTDRVPWFHSPEWREDRMDASGRTPEEHLRGIKGRHRQDRGGHGVGSAIGPTPTVTMPRSAVEAFWRASGWEPQSISDFMRSVQREAGVFDRSHIENGCKAAFDAATTHLEDGKGYGVPAMKEFFGDDVAKCLVKLLQYREVDKDATLERMNDRYCIMPFGGKVRVLTFKEELDRSVMTFYSAADFKLMHDNVLVTEDGKAMGRGSWWIKHPLRRQYEGLVFAPGSPRVIESRWSSNLWQGWGITPRPGSWELLRQHILGVLANGDNGHADYVIKWTAWTFQNPALMAETALVFRGVQGSGKGLYGRLMCSAFGQHGVHISSGSSR